MSTNGVNNEQKEPKEALDLKNAREKNLKEDLKITASQDNESVTITYLEKYHGDQLTFLSLLLALCLILAAGFIGIFIMVIQLQNPSPVYFPATNRNALLPEFSLSEPNMATNALLNWVTETMMDVNTFNYIDYESNFANAKQYFTKEGFDYYIKAMQTAGVIDKVINGRLVARARPDSAPQITKEGVLAGRYLWKINMKMVFDYRNVDVQLSENADITLLVMRVSNAEAPIGVKILKYDISLKRY